MEPYLDSLIQCAEVSNAAYSKKLVYADTLKKKGFKISRFSNSSTGTQGIACVNAQECIIGFSGTELNSLRDIWTDLQVRRKPLSRMVKFFSFPENIEVHEGFLKSAMSVEHIVNELVQLYRGTHIIKFTGHSLGGSLALLCAVAFDTPHVVTFGAPRTGNWAWSRFCQNLTDHKRILNRGDPVPYVPLGNYFHDAPSILIGKSWDLKLDHPIEAYIESLINLK